MEWFIQFGYWGLFVGSFFSATILPVSSDVIMISLLALGANKWILLVSASTGSWLGNYSSYCLGWLAEWDKLEKWFKIKHETLEKQEKIINKYGLWLAFFSWIPIIGTLSVITLGFYRVRPKSVCVLILAGCFARFLFWVVLHDLFIG
jgi:membrane protein YqaA with SNARE-associated domain